MKNKTFYFLFFFILSFNFQQNLGNEARENFKEREWEFLQYEISKKISKKTGNISSVLKQFASFFGPICASIYLANKFDEKSCTPGLAIITGMLTGFFLAHAIKVGDENDATYKTYLTFIKNWPQNKPYTPKSLHSAFDELYLLYQKDEIFSEEFQNNYQTLKEIISEALYNRFPPPLVVYNSPPIVYYHA